MWVHCCFLVALNVRTNEGQLRTDGKQVWLHRTRYKSITLLCRGAANSSGRISFIWEPFDKQHERACVLQDEIIVAFAAPSETRHQC